MNCNEWPSQTPTLSPEQFLQRLREIDAYVNNKQVEILSQSHTISSVLNSRTWPGDSLMWVVRCVQSNKTFSLFANTYHGSSDWNELHTLYEIEQATYQCRENSRS